MPSFLPTITLLHIFPLKPILFLVCRNRQPLHTAIQGDTLRRFEFLGQRVEIELQEGSLAGVVQASKSMVQANKQVHSASKRVDGASRERLDPE